MRYYVHAITGILLDKLPVNGLSITSLENQKIKVSFFDKGTTFRFKLHKSDRFKASKNGHDT